MIWYKDECDSIVMSTRIRLARNLEKTPFPSRLKDSERAAVTEKLAKSITNSNSTLSQDFTQVRLDELSECQKQVMVEEHLISPQMVNGKDKSVLISSDRTMSIMLMEEDHIRLQVILGGEELDKAYDLANRVDDVMEEELTYAYDERFGYLTACPTNAGTGLRASVMMHLPALVITGNMDRLLQSFSGMGITVRGAYGEGTNADGDMFQISNSITMGLDEREIIERVKEVTAKIRQMEMQARELLSEKRNVEIADKVMRSYGVLKYARRLTSKEAKALLSDCLLGYNMGIISEKAKIPQLELMIKTSPAMISDGGTRSAGERDVARAKLIRENI